MKVEIVELLREGIRLPRTEVLQSVPIKGELSVGLFEAEDLPGRIPAQVARLKVPYGSQELMADVIPPLFEPRLIRMTRGGFVLRGMQLSSNTTGVRQLSQEWWARVCK